MGPCAPEQGSNTVKWREMYNVLSAYALGPVHLRDGPQSSTNFSPLLPSHCPGNQYSQPPHWGKAGRMMCAPFGELAHGAVHVYYMQLCISNLCLSYTCQIVFISVLQRKKDANYALSSPYEFTSITLQHPDCHIVTEVTCLQSDIFFSCFLVS